MKYAVFIVGCLILAALNWTALHDILKGEPDVWIEWMIVVTSTLLVVTIAAKNRRTG